MLSSTESRVKSLPTFLYNFTYLFVIVRSVPELEAVLFAVVLVVLAGAGLSAMPNADYCLLQRYYY